MTQVIDQVLQANMYLQPIQLILGVVTNMLNIRILCSRKLRSSSCTHYFLAYAIFSIVYTCILCPTQFLRGFSIVWAHGKLGCKIHFYILFVLPFQANLMLVFASYDRYCSSAYRRQSHSRNTIRRARTTILLGTFVCFMYMLPMLMIYNWNAHTKTCLPDSNFLINIYVSSQAVVYYILIPLLMVVFGLLTISNIRQRSVRPGLRAPSHRGRRTEGQLTRMLLLQVGVHLMLVLPFGIAYIITFFKPSTQTPIMLAARLAFVTWQQCDYFLSLFLYVLSGNVYRKQFRRILQSVRCLTGSGRFIRRHRLSEWRYKLGGKEKYRKEYTEMTINEVSTQPFLNLT